MAIAYRCGAREVTLGGYDQPGATLCHDGQGALEEYAARTRGSQDRLRTRSQVPATRPRSARAAKLSISEGPKSHIRAWLLLAPSRTVQGGPTAEVAGNILALQASCNQIRDARNRRALVRAGWAVLTIRECDLLEHMHVKRRLQEFLVVSPFVAALR